MRLRISVIGRVRPSVRPSVGPSVGRSVSHYSKTTNVVIFEGYKSLNDMTINCTISDDEAVASDVPPRYLLLSTPAQVNLNVPELKHGLSFP